jgi:halimadienyl-diphosphate synthase
VFEKTWILWNLSLCSGWDKNILNFFDTFVDYLHKNWNPNKGIGLSIGFTIPDGDDTSLVYEVLSKFNKAPDIESVLAFEEEEHFRTYHFEANSSRSVNIHSLGALRAHGLSVDHPSVKKILHYLNNTKLSDSYWVDKWNLSPYYTTSHAIIACAGYANSLVENSIDWITSTQRTDGSWGQHISTAEETAYALQALNVWKQNGRKISPEIIKKGTKWLEAHNEPPYPPLWIGKGLYCPLNVVQSAIISALHLSMETQ